MIIQALLARQRTRGGYLTDEDLRDVARELATSLHRIQELVSFYPHFRTKPPPKVEVHVCRDMSCHLRGSARVIDELQTWTKGSFDAAEVEVCGVSCLGRCDRAPAALVNEQLYVSRSIDQLKQIVASHHAEEPATPNTDWELAGLKVGAWDMDVYAGNPKYDAIRQYVDAPNPEVVLEALETAGLLGMGGAGGRTYKKWTEVLEAQGRDKFIVCNADESEPGTFKDREILLAAPHLTLEGMILAGLVVGASKGWVYTRHEYPEQIARVREEIFNARRLGVLGNNILGSGLNFELDVFVSPGNYICGEQTALIEAMEDKRAEPRIRPPELQTNGYRNQPTLLNNVETFAWVPAIMLRAAGEWFASQGVQNGAWIGTDDADKMKGKRLFSISGDVKRPGVYEVPTGISLGELIDKHCGGMADGKEIVAVALSGPSGGLLPRFIPLEMLGKRTPVPEGRQSLDILELPLDINISRTIGLMIGAGMVVYGTGTDVVAEAAALSRFFQRESCGKCVPCRLGSRKITHIGEQLRSGEVHPGDLPVLRATAAGLSDVMRVASICGLGVVASNPIRSLLDYFPAEVERACQSSEVKRSGSTRK